MNVNKLFTRNYIDFYFQHVLLLISSCAFTLFHSSIPNQHHTPLIRGHSNYIKKNVDTKCSAHYAFLEYPSSGTLKITIIRYAQNRKIGKPNNLKFLEQYFSLHERNKLTIEVQTHKPTRQRQIIITQGDIYV